MTGKTEQVNKNLDITVCMYTDFNYIGEREKNINVGGKRKNCWNDAFQGIPAMMSSSKRKWEFCKSGEIRFK